MYDSFFYTLSPHYQRRQKHTDWRKLRLVLADGVSVCQITRWCECKLFLDLPLFRMRYICIERSVIFCQNDLIQSDESAAALPPPALSRILCCSWHFLAVDRMHRFQWYLHRFPCIKAVFRGRWLPMTRKPVIGKIVMNDCHWFSNYKRLPLANDEQLLLPK